MYRLAMMWMCLLLCGCSSPKLEINGPAHVTGAVWHGVNELKAATGYETTGTINVTEHRSFTEFANTYRRLGGTTNPSRVGAFTIGHGGSTHAIHGYTGTTQPEYTHEGRHPGCFQNGDFTHDDVRIKRIDPTWRD